MNVGVTKVSQEMVKFSVTGHVLKSAYMESARRALIISVCVTWVGRDRTVALTVVAMGIQLVKTRLEYVIHARRIPRVTAVTNVSLVVMEMLQIRWGVQNAIVMSTKIYQLEYVIKPMEDVFAMIIQQERSVRHV